MITINDFDLDKINIMAVTNIDATKPVELKPDMFIFDKKISGDNMWICTNARYSEEVLMTKTHFECLEIFYDKDKFVAYLVQSRLKKTGDNSNQLRKMKTKWLNSQGDDEQCKNKVNCFIKENMLLMLKYCFKITFPVDNPPYAYSSKRPSSFSFNKFLSKLGNADSYANYTHMNISNKKTTLIQCRWLDNAVFHPMYQLVMRKIDGYLKRVGTNIVELIDGYLKLLNDTFKSGTTTSATTTTTALILTETLPGLLDEYNTIDKITNFLTEIRTRIEDESKIGIADMRSLQVFMNIHYDQFYKKVAEKQVAEKQGKLKEVKTNEEIEKMDKIEKILGFFRNKPVAILILLTNTFSTQAYKDIYDKMKLSSIDMARYDYYKPYLDNFALLSSPNRISTNEIIADCFDENKNSLYEITSVSSTFKYKIYEENGFYDIINQNPSPYIGLDKINQAESKKQSPHYELYLALDLAGGLVTDANFSAVSCYFENNRLGNMGDKLINKTENTEVLQMIEYIDMTERLDKYNKEQAKIQSDEKKKAEAKQAEAKQAEAKQAETSNAEKVSITTEANPDKNNPENFVIKNELIKQSVDKISGITEDFQKVIVSKINRKENELKINKLADLIKKYNDNRNDIQVKRDLDTFARQSLNNVKSTIATLDNRIKNGDLEPEKKSQEESTLATYKYILEVVKNLISLIEDEDVRKNIKGGKRLRKKTRRNQRQKQRRKTMRRNK